MHSSNFNKKHVIFINKEVDIIARFMWGGIKGGMKGLLYLGEYTPNEIFELLFLRSLF